LAVGKGRQTPDLLGGGGWMEMMGVGEEIHVKFFTRIIFIFP